MKKYLFILLFFCNSNLFAQYAFEMKIDFAIRVNNNDDLFSISGTLLSGRVEKGKTYYAENGSKIEVNNIISQKTGTTSPVANSPEGVALAITCKNYNIERGEVLKCVSSKSAYYGNNTGFNPGKMKEGELYCKINGRMYTSFQVSKPVLIKNVDVLDMFFQAEDKSVIWLQLNNFSEINNIPHTAKSDTSVKERAFVCKMAYLPSGYKPSDGANNYVGYEDVKGNAGIVVVYLDKYNKKIALSFSGILRANSKMQTEKPNAGLFYITEGKIDNLSWDAF